MWTRHLHVIGVGRLFDMLRTSTNVLGDASCAASSIVCWGRKRRLTAIWDVLERKAACSTDEEAHTRYFQKTYHATKPTE